jgi:hypothetical protein
VLACNCSICAKKGFLGLIVPAENFQLLAGEDALATYRFGTRTAAHRFCRTCGIHPFSRPRSHPEGFDVNARCLDDGFEDLEIAPFHGQLRLCIVCTCLLAISLALASAEPVFHTLMRACQLLLSVHLSTAAETSTCTSGASFNVCIKACLTMSGVVFGAATPAFKHSTT